jgi:autotransporter-associated beta strand protein
MPILTLPRASKAIRLTVLVLTVALLPGRIVSAADRQWNGSTGTTWTAPANWTGGAPGLSDNAVFNGTFTNQPNVSGTNALGGLWMTGNVGQNVTIGGSGTLQLGGNTINGTAGMGILVDNTSAYSLTINAVIQLTAAQTWTNNSSNVLTVGTGGLNITSHAFTLNGSGNTTISGVLSGSGAIVKSGSGKLTLSNASNTYTGQLTVQGGTLSVSTINNTSTAGSLGNNALTVILGGAGGSTGTLEYTGGNISKNKTFTLATAGTGAFQVTTGGTQLTLSGVIDGAGSLAKTGTGTLILSGANSYTGTTTISEGTLSAVKIAAISASSSIGNAATAVVLGGGTTAGTLRYTGAAVTYTRGFTVNAGGGGITNAGTGLLTIGTGGIATAGNLTFVTNANGITANSIISGAGGVTMDSGGAGALIMAAANTYAGGTTVTQGTVQMSGAGTLGASSGSLTVNGGTLDLNGTTQSVGNFTGSGGTIVNNASGTNVALTIGTADGTGGNYAGVIADNTSGTGTVALTKTGSGTITLSGTNTYTGATTINGGTLSAANAGNGGQGGAGNEALGGTSAVAITTGGTLLLESSNQINDAAAIGLAGGTLALNGQSEGAAGVAGAGTLTLTASSSLDFGADGLGNSLIQFAAIGGAIDLNDNIILQITNWQGAAVTGDGVERLLFSGSASEFTTRYSQSEVTFDGTAGYAAVQFGDYYEITTPGFAEVPEPLTVFGGLTLLGMAGYRERRRAAAWWGMFRQAGLA